MVAPFPTEADSTQHLLHSVRCCRRGPEEVGTGYGTGKGTAPFKDDIEMSPMIDFNRSKSKSNLRLLDRSLKIILLILYFVAYRPKDIQENMIDHSKSGAVVVGCMGEVLLQMPKETSLLHQAEAARSSAAAVASSSSSSSSASCRANQSGSRSALGKEIKSVSKLSMKRSCDERERLAAKFRYSRRMLAKLRRCILRRQPTTTPASLTPVLQWRRMPVISLGAREGKRTMMGKSGETHASQTRQGNEETSSKSSSESLTMRSRLMMLEAAFPYRSMPEQLMLELTLAPSSAKAPRPRWTSRILRTWHQAASAGGLRSGAKRRIVLSLSVERKVSRGKAGAVVDDAGRGFG